MSGIKSNSSDKLVIATGAKWTGIVNMKVVAINPTASELLKMGMRSDKEPIYNIEQTDSQGNTRKSYRLDVFLNEPLKKINAKVAFFLEDRVRSNQAGTKVEWINKYGQTSWSESVEVVPQYDWFKQDGTRPALVGEGLLTSFIMAWANVGAGDQGALDEPDKLAKGNLTEIKSILSSIPNNEIQVLLGVNDKGYQTVYTGYFDRPYRKAFDAWKKALANEYGAFKADYQGDLFLKIYEGGKTVAQDTPTNMDVPTTENKPTYNF